MARFLSGMYRIETTLHEHDNLTEAWHRSLGAFGAWALSHYHESCNNSNLVWSHKACDVGYKRTVLLGQWERKTQAAIHCQYRSTKDKLEILLRILSIDRKTISSLINTRDWLLYAWSTTYTCQVCMATDCQVFWQSSCSFRSTPLIPHLLCGIQFM